MPIFYFIGGLANSGKSTLLRNLNENFNILIVSTSAEVHYQYRLAHGGSDLDTKQPELRQQFIDWVEGYYIPSLGGRNFFASNLVASALANPKLNQYSAIAFETVGGDEFDAMVEALPLSVIYRAYNCNRDDQLPGVDLRKPLPDATELDCNQVWLPSDYVKFFPELVAKPKILDANLNLIGSVSRTCIK